MALRTAQIWTALSPKGPSATPVSEMMTVRIPLGVSARLRMMCLLGVTAASQSATQGHAETTASVVVALVSPIASCAAAPMWIAEAATNVRTLKISRDVCPTAPQIVNVEMTHFPSAISRAGAVLRVLGQAMGQLVGQLVERQVEPRQAVRQVGAQLVERQAVTRQVVA